MKARVKVVKENQYGDEVFGETLLLTKEELKNYLLKNVEDLSYFNKETLYNEICEREYHCNVQYNLDQHDLHNIISYRDFLEDYEKELNNLMKITYEGEGLYVDYEEAILIPLEDGELKDGDYCFSHTIKGGGWLENPILGQLYVKIKWVEEDVPVLRIN
jgi:hypothetical protein